MLWKTRNVVESPLGSLLAPPIRNLFLLSERGATLQVPACSSELELALKSESTGGLRVRTSIAVWAWNSWVWGEIELTEKGGVATLLPLLGRLFWELPEKSVGRVGFQ